MNQLLDFIYPSFCIYCKSKINFKKTLCTACSEHLMLEMDDTVMHVLEENPITLTYLKFIRAHYPKSHIQILAAFTIVKYYRLFSEKPLSITSSKNKLANMVAKHIAKNFNIRAKKNTRVFSKEDQAEHLYFHFPNKKTAKLTII